MKFGLIKGQHMVDINDLKKERKLLEDQKIKIIKRIEDEIFAVRTSFGPAIKGVESKINILDNQMKNMGKSQIAQRLRQTKRAAGI